MYSRAACQFSQAFWLRLSWGGHLYWGFVILIFQIYNLGEMEFPSPVDRSDRHVALRKI